MITCIILTHNSASSIEAAIASVRWCDEIICIDDEFADETLSLIKKNKVVVYVRPLKNDFAAQRNFGLSKAKEPWVLFLDSDEVVSEELKKDIQDELAKAKTADAYYIPRLDVLFGKTLRHGDTGNARFIRLAKIGAGKWEREIHETWKVHGEVKTFTHPLLHSPHPSIKIFLSQINWYTTVNAQVFFKQGKHATLPAIIGYPIGKFLYIYIVQLGFLDGTPGFIMAMMMAFHSFLTRAKLWQLTDKKI